MAFGLYNQLISQSSKVPNRVCFKSISRSQVGQIPALSKSFSKEEPVSNDKTSSDSATSTSQSIAFSSADSSAHSSASRIDRSSEESNKRARRQDINPRNQKDLENLKRAENTKRKKRDERREMFASLGLSFRSKVPPSESRPLYSTNLKNFFQHLSVAQHHQPNPSPLSPPSPPLPFDSISNEESHSLPWKLDRESFSVADSPRTNTKKAVTDWPLTIHPGVNRPCNVTYAFNDAPWRLSLSAFLSPHEDVFPSSYRVKPDTGRMMLLSKRVLSEKMSVLRYQGWELIENGTKMRKTVRDLTDQEAQRWLGLSESKIRTLVVQWLSLIGQCREHDPDEVFVEGSTLVISLQTHEARTKLSSLKPKSVKSAKAVVKQPRLPPLSAPSSPSPELSMPSSTSIPDRIPGITPSDIALAWSIEAFLRDLKTLGSKPPAGYEAQPYEWTE